MLGTTNKYYVEFGFNNKEQCSGSGPNTCRLWKEHSWKGLLLDGNNSNQAINLQKHWLSESNIASIFAKYNVPTNLDYLSCAMDSHDLFVMRGILSAGYRPSLITTEFITNWPP
eukprot:1057562-Rhodomonas_salina.1